MATERELKKVLGLLAVWIERIRANNAILLFDINKIAESFCLKLLNLVYGLDLKDLNQEKSNFPGLDLGDKVHSKIAYQVTSRTDTAKVINTLRTVVKKNYNQSFTGGIRFLILSHGEKIKFPRIKPATILSTFKADTDIIYIDEIYNEIKKIFDSDEILFLKIKTLVESDISVDDLSNQNGSSNELIALISGLNKQIEQLQQELKVDFKLNNHSFFAKDLSIPNVPVISNRVTCIKEVVEKLANYKHLWIFGNISTGKTQLALLVARQHPRNSYWFDAAQINNAPGFVEMLVKELTITLNINPGLTLQNAIKEIFRIWGAGSMLILNDVPQIVGKELDKRNFYFFLKEAMDAGVNIIITSNYDIPFVDPDEISSHIVHYPIPMFKEEETGEVMKGYGASDEIIEEAAAVITALTHGHPLMINAVCKYLRERNWEIDNDAIEAIFKGDVGEQYQAEVYSRIIESTNDENSKNLLYRLRPIIGEFSDSEITAVSNVQPEINHPLETIQKLKGIWLKIVDDGKLELSPLVKQLGSNLGDRLENEVNTVLGDLILSKKLISQIEAYTVLNYYKRGNAYAKLSLVLILVLQESMKNKDLFFTWGFDLYWYYTKLPDGISPFFKVFIRFLQINVALQHEKDVEFLAKDIAEISDHEDVGELGKVMKSLVLHHVFAKTKPQIALSNFIEAQDRMAALDIDLPGIPMKEMVQDDFIWLSFYKLQERADFEAWFATFEKIKGRFTGKDIRTSQGYIVAGHSLVRLCLVTKEGLDEGIKTLIIIADLAVKTDLPLLAVYALRYIIRLNALHQIDMEVSQGIVNRYKELINADPIYKYLIEEEMGRQLYYTGQSEAALTMLDVATATALPELYVEDFDIYWIYARLVEKENGQKAHEFLMRGFRKAISDPRSTMLDRIKMYGEAGISFWLSGNNKQALCHLEKGYELLLDNFENSPEHQAAVIRYGSISNYVKCIVIDGIAPTKTGDGGNYAVPIRGNFYQSVDRMLEGGYYFDERKFISAVVFEDAFEFYDDRPTAKKWASRCMEISMQLSDPKFAAVLFKDIFYLIGDGNYQKAVNLYLYVEGHLQKLNALKDAEKNPGLKVALEQSNASERNEPYFFQYVILPPVFTIAMDIVSGKIQQAELPGVINDLFTHVNIGLKDEETLKFIHQVYQKILIEKISIDRANILLDSYKGGYKSQVLTIGYILSSIDAPVMDAIRMHFSLMPSIEEAFNDKFNAFYRFNIVPFFETYWKKKFDQQKADFLYPEHWESASVPYFTNATLRNRLRFLFQSLGHHLDVPLTSKLADWISAK